MHDVTQLLSAMDQGDPTAGQKLLPLVYDELRKVSATADEILVVEIQSKR